MARRIRVTRPVTPGAMPGHRPGLPGPAVPPVAPGPLLASVALLFALLLAIYALTACRTVGPGDSGELAVVLSTWSVAHPPGFPLLSLVGNLVSHLPHPGEPAFVLNLLSGCFGALACAVLALAVATLGGSATAGLVAGLALGISPIFWRYSLVIEVFSLNALLAALLLLFLACFLRHLAGRRAVLWPLPASALVMSGVVTHQPTLVLIAAPVLLVYLAAVPALLRAGVGKARLARTTLLCVAAGVAGLLPLLYLPLAAGLDPPLNWGDVHDPGGLLRFLLRQDFGTGTLISPATTVQSVLERGESASPLGFRHYRLFWASLPAGFGWPFTALVVLGAAWAARRSREITILLVAFAIALTLFFARVNTPVAPLYIGISEAFYVLPHVVIALLGGLGLAALLAWSRRERRVPAAWVAAIAAAAMLLPLPARWRDVDMRHNTFTRDFGANLMSGMPRGALVFSDGDLFRNSFHYQQACLGRRPDLTLVEQNMMLLDWYVGQLRRRRALRLPRAMTAYDADPATRSRAWLDLNLGTEEGAEERPVLAVRFIDETYASAYRLVPMGLWHRVVPRSRRVDLAAWADAFDAVARGWDLASLRATYPKTSWETSETVFYVYALANRQAARDVADAFGHGAREEGAAPWTEDSLVSRGPSRADHLAYQAEFWRLRLVDSPASAPRPPDSLLAERAMALARASLAIEGDNLQALQTVAALMHQVPRYRDPRAEVAIRLRIVRQRPGDLAELVPYFELVGTLSADPASRDEEILRQSERVRQRFLGLLEICMKLSSDLRLAEAHRRWRSGSPPVSRRSGEADTAVRGRPKP